MAVREPGDRSGLLDSIAQVAYNASIVPRLAPGRPTEPNGPAIGVNSSGRKGAVAGSSRRSASEGRCGPLSRGGREPGSPRKSSALPVGNGRCVVARLTIGPTVNNPKEEFMIRKKFHLILALLVGMSMLLAACDTGGSATPTTAGSTLCNISSATASSTTPNTPARPTRSSWACSAWTRRGRGGCCPDRPAL